MFITSLWAFLISATSKIVLICLSKSSLSSDSIASISSLYFLISFSFKFGYSSVLESSPLAFFLASSFACFSLSSFTAGSSSPWILLPNWFLTLLSFGSFFAASKAFATASSAAAMFSAVGSSLAAFTASSAAVVASSALVSNSV